VPKHRYRGVPNKVRESVWERCSGICEGPVVRVRDGALYIAERTGHCGKAAEQLAHVEPRKMGGSRNKYLDTPENLIYLCTRCHDVFDLRVFEKE
jgi:hypothetical protein